MTAPSAKLPLKLSSRAEKRPDLTGRERLVSNVLFSWAAHSVFIVSGFIMPRMIDRRLGQDLLGVWDFAWSLVNYFSLVQMGIGASVNRYVAKYRAVGDTASMNRAVSSAFCILGMGSLVAVGLAGGFSLLLPELFGGRLGEHAREAQWVLFLLGLSLAVQVALGISNGILTGCHCWGVHNVNTGGWHAITVIGMIVALLCGGRLWILAAITLMGEACAGIRRMMLAYQVCEGLRVRPSLVTGATVRELFGFAGKTLIPAISKLLLNQTTSILIVSHLGPGALALYSRPRSLMLHVETLVRKMAMTLTPTTSSLQSMGDSREIQELTIKAARYSLYLALPVVMALVVFGGPIIQFWMGPRYRGNLVPAILAGGSLAVLVQLPALNILAGLNAHGRAGMGRLVASLCSVGLNVVVLKYLGWGLAGTAIAVTLPLTVLNIVDIPLLICRRVGLGVRRYYASVLIGPAVHTLPFLLCLIVARLISQSRPLVGLALGGAVGGAILAVVYWRNVLPDSVRVKICNVVRSSGRVACGLVSGK